MSGRRKKMKLRTHFATQRSIKTVSELSLENAEEDALVQLLFSLDGGDKVTTESEHAKSANDVAISDETEDETALIKGATLSLEKLTLTAAALVFRVVLMGRSSVDVQAEEQVKDALAERDVVVIFSKTYCGFCAAVKRLFERLGIRYRALELDILPLGSAMQRILYEMTGQRTVPSVWVRGRHLGGNDAVQELHRTGRLLPLLDESGIAHA